MTPSRTVPPEPQRFFNCVASAWMSAAGNGNPVTVVTPLPALPWVSRPTRTAAGLAAPGAPRGQTHSRTARRQFGHSEPIPVE